jgi:cell division protease FtsH
MFSKSAIWVVVALLLFMLFKNFDGPGTSGSSKSIPYSELLDEVKAQRIKDVLIQGSLITATRSDDSKVTATLTGLDRGLIGDLRDNNVKFDVKPAEEQSFLQTIFISASGCSSCARCKAAARAAPSPSVNRRRA